MPLLGRSVATVEGSPERELPLRNADGEKLKGMFVTLRLLPRPFTEKLLKPVQRKFRKNDPEESEEALARWMREQTAASLVDTRGVDWSFDDAAQCESYKPFFPGLKPGVAVSLDGRWTAEFKAKFLDEHPHVSSLFLDAYKRMAQLGAEEDAEIEAGKGETSSSSSSGS